MPRTATKVIHLESSSITIASSLLAYNSILPALFGGTTLGNNVQEPAGGLNLASVSALKNGTSSWTVCISGVLRAGVVLPEESRLARVVTRRKRFLILPDTGTPDVILKVLSHTR